MNNLLNLDELLAYCKWAREEYLKNVDGPGSETEEYAIVLNTGMSMAFDAVADMIEGKISVPTLPDPAKVLFADLDEPMSAEDL